MTIRAVLFDLGGVLFRSVNQGQRSFWEKRLGVSGRQIAEAVWLSPVGRRALIGQATEEEVWEEVGRQFSLNSDELLRLESDFRDESTLDVDLLSYIRALRHEYQTGVISDAFLSARSRLQSIIPPDTFDIMIFSAEEGIVKPNPIIFQRALERLGVSPQETIFVDDLPQNVAGASSLGIHAIQFSNSMQVQQEIKSLLIEGKEAAG